MTDAPLTDPADPAALDLFLGVAARDRAAHPVPDMAEAWKLRADARQNGRLDHMRFETFDGVAHLERMLLWIHGFRYGPVPGRAVLAPLVAQSLQADQAVCKAAGIDADKIDLANIAWYNAQDHHFQRVCPVPARLRPRRILDFGAGHGRQANLLRDGIASGDITYTAMDITPACYLVQRLYFRLLGLNVTDYIDLETPPATPRDLAALAAPGSARHLPAWRFDLLARDSQDMVIAVQVLREMSKPALMVALGHIHRVLKPGGAFYIRDHVGFHNPNAVDLDAALAAQGFIPEWQSRLIDRQDVHGVPRIWRKPDMAAVLGLPAEGQDRA